MPQLFDLYGTPFNPENPTLDYAATTQLITAVTDTLTPVGGFLKFSADNPYTLTSTPSVETENAKAGDIVTLYNVGATNAVTLAWGAPPADPPNAGETGLKLGLATRAIGPGGSIRLMFDGSSWVELAWLTASAIA